MPYSTYLYLDFHLCSMTKLKEHSREICYPKGKCWLEQHCTLWTFPKADCCGLSAMPRRGGSCRPLILAKLSFVESLPFVLSLISLSGAACTFKIYSCSASTCSILSTRSAEASKWAEEKPTGIPSSRHMIILNILFETPIYSKEDENILWL